MPDARFYIRSGPFTLREIADRVGAELGAGAVASSPIADVASLAKAGSGDLTFLADAELCVTLAGSNATACLVKDGLEVTPPSGLAIIKVRDARAAFAHVATLFYPDSLGVPAHGPAKIAKDADIAPSAVIGPGAVIGAGVRIGALSVIGAGVEIGAGSWIASNVTITHCLMGPRCIVHPGVRIGQDGFGFAPGARGLMKVPQLGRVIIGADVEIGANSCIDRGALDDTEIGDGTKFDNLVQIGHNVRIGRNCVLVAQVGVSGSCTIGDGVVIGGQTAISDHITIGNRAQIAGKSGVMRDVLPDQAVMGYPAQPIRQFWRGIATLSRLTKRDK